MTGCNQSSTGRSSSSATWRTDTNAITSRFPLVAGATSFVWKGELAGKSSRMSAPGPSAYRVCCFTEGFSHAYSEVTALSDFEPVKLPSETSFPEHLRSASTTNWFSSRTIDSSLFTLKYQGKAFYAPDLDLLYFDVFWQ